MARLPRVVIPGCPHHLIQRGNRRQPVFFSDEDRAFYLILLKRQFDKFGVALWAFCLMANHVHMIAVPRAKDSFLGKKEQIDASKAVRAEIDKALELDQTNHLAWHALGRWHRRMDEIGGMKRALGSLIYGSIPKGSYAESEKALRKAIELHPEYVNHYLELGRTLVALKKYDEARGSFQQALDLPKTTSKDDVIKAEAKTELDALAAKKK